MVLSSQTCSEGFGDDQLMLSLGYQALAYQVLLLLARVSECFGSAADDSSIPSKIASDWRDFFSEASYAIVLPMFMSMAGRSTYTKLSCPVNFSKFPAAMSLQRDLY